MCVFFRPQSHLLPPLLCGLLASISFLATAQEPRVASPAGHSATEIAGAYSQREGYANGKWIDILYGRPIKRGRNLFDLPDWREALLDGAEVWRAGANVTTRLRTETKLKFGDTVIPPGEYAVFIEFDRADSEDESWTFILSTWSVQLSYDYENTSALWGAYEYTPDKDVVRESMTVSREQPSFDQLSWQFIDMNDDEGSLVLLWDTIRATVSFSF